jgi:hypothetical protein
VWVKGYFGDPGRDYRVAGVAEVAFYRDLVATTGVRTLRAVVADVDFDTSDNILVTEDELGTGARFLHGLDGYTVDQTAQSLEQLALLHARTWMRSDLATLRWLASRFSLFTLTRGLAEIRDNFEGPVGAGVPDAVRDPSLLFEGYQEVGRRLTDARPWTVVHGDPHIGNLMVDPDGRPAFVDWQLVQRGPWYLDVGYHIASVLPVEDRRVHEIGLVEHYLDALEAGGVDRPRPADVWPGLRLGMIHGFYLWGITQKVDPRKTAVLLERLGTAVDDHQAFAEIGR